MTSRWKIKDIIDLEYFLGKDAPSETDRNIYLQHIRPQADAKSWSSRLVIRQWLDHRRALEKEKLGADAVLPGEVFDEIYQLLCYLLMIAGIVSGAGLAFSLLAYKGIEPLNISVCLGILVGTQMILIFFLLSALMIRKFKRTSERAPLLYSLLGSLLVRIILMIRDKGLKTLSGAHRTSLEAVVNLISNTETDKGLRIMAMPDENIYHTKSLSKIDISPVKPYNRFYNIFILS